MDLNNYSIIMGQQYFYNHKVIRAPKSFEFTSDHPSFPT